MGDTLELEQHVNIAVTTKYIWEIIMPISANQFQEATSAQDRLKNVLDTVVKLSHHIIKEEGLNPIEIRISKKKGSYHRRHDGTYSITYGAGTFDRKLSRHFEVEIVSNGNTITTKANLVPYEVQIMSIIFEEVGHHLQVLDGGRWYGSCHNSIYYTKFRYLWDKYSDEFLPIIVQSMKCDGLTP